jgi:hypothetical protein
LALLLPLLASTFGHLPFKVYACIECCLSKSAILSNTVKSPLLGILLESHYAVQHYRVVGAIQIDRLWG